MQDTAQNAFEHAQSQIKKACSLYDKCEIDGNNYEVISNPKRILEVNIPIKMDSGKTKVFTGFRCQHNDARGPFKGGIRFHQDVTHLVDENEES